MKSVAKHEHPKNTIERTHFTYLKKMRIDKMEAKVVKRDANFDANN